uniref:Uncharacterized protein n=1 Tax=Cacopsylla melanoneura TaxID=428564 RepID=A0A8D9BVH8_9HEMI
MLSDVSTHPRIVQEKTQTNTSDIVYYCNFLTYLPHLICVSVFQELLCLQCKKLVKINNRKIKRSEISVKVEKTRDSGGKVSKEKKTKQNKKDEICVESTGDTLATKKEKKKKKNKKNKKRRQED